MESICAEVLTFGIFDRPLLYKVPTRLINNLVIGTLVHVPFGQRKIFGIVSKILSYDISQSEFQIKEIYELIYDHALISHDLIELIIWMAKYYAASYKSLLESVIPSTIRNCSDPKSIPKFSLSKILSDTDVITLQNKFPKQWEVYKFLSEKNCTVEKSDIKRFSASAVRTLIKNGLIKRFMEPVNRVVRYDTSKEIIDSNTDQISLTPEQESATTDIIDSVHKRIFSTHLLHGITGSGKTEVYMSVMRKVLEDDGNIIYLVPELALTPQTVDRIRRGLKISDDKVVVWHSGLSEGERRDAWLAMSKGHAKIVIGARSAIFSPLKNIRLIIVDEEHESTYKQCESPRYHARDVAVYRSKLCHAVCILGSATPSMESLFNVFSKKYQLNVLKHRIDGSSLPIVEVVDMRFELSKNSKRIISQRLESLMTDRLEKNEQIILFLNKRGHSSLVFCDNCDYSANCPNCSTSLTYHKPQNTLRCHICNYVENLMTRCPKCGNYHLLQSGVGTQKLTSVVSEMFPSAKVERIDSDVMSTKHGFSKILKSFGDGDIDILIGTQMISKGLDFPNVSLVGVINVDHALNIPDFRSNEKVFQSIVQVAGRAGRGLKPGNVVIQTNFPDSKLIQLAMAHDCDNFFINEIQTRKEFFYPPISHLIRVIFSGKNEIKTEMFACSVAEYLKSYEQSNFEVRGPSPAIISRINNNFRFSILCFSVNVGGALIHLRRILSTVKKPNSVNVVIDVDPVDMM